MKSQYQAPTSPVADGLVYYMPVQAIKVTVTFAAATAGEPAPPGIPSVDPIDPMPDPSRRFVLNYEQNYVGKNHLVLTVSASGLLTSSNAQTTSGVATIVANLGKALGAAQALALAAGGGPGPKPANPPKPVCSPGRSYSLLIHPGADDTKICDYSVSIRNIDGKPIGDPNKTKIPDTSKVSNEQSQNGVFYRQEIPYLVTVTDPSGKQVTEFTGYSTDLSPISYFPVTPTLFADGQANLTFSNGVLTGVDTSSDGELVALTELPADFISAYTTAIGNVLGPLGTNVQDQTTLINNQRALALAAVNEKACSASISANSAVLSPSNLQHKTTEQLATAVDAINAALTAIKTACQQ